MRDEPFSRKDVAFLLSVIGATAGLITFVYSFWITLGIIFGTIIIVALVEKTKSKI